MFSASPNQSDLFRSTGPLVSAARQHYDKYIAELEQETQVLPELRARLSVAEQTHSEQLRSLTLKHQKQVQDLEATIADQQAELERAEATIADQR